MKICAVIGARGMLGQTFVRHLAEAYPEVRAQGLDLGEIDITSHDNVVQHPALQDCDTIINCAAYTNVEKCEDEEELATAVNGSGVANLAALARKTGALLVHVSTDFVFDGTRATPYPPDAPRGPLSAYGRSKLAGEQALESSGARYALVRTAWLYGLGGKNFVETMLNLARQYGKLSVVADQVGSPTCTTDLATALARVAAGRAEGTWHCTNAGAASWHQFACEIVRQAGFAVPVEPLTTAEAEERFKLKATRPRYSVLDCSGLEQRIGLRMRPWQDALADYLASRPA